MVVHLPSVLEMKSGCWKMPLIRFYRPEGFASILWKDSKKAKEAAEIMKITAKDLKALGIIEQVIEEPYPACEENLEEISENMKRRCENFFREWIKKQKKNWQKTVMNVSARCKNLRR